MFGKPTTNFGTESKSSSATTFSFKLPSEPNSQTPAPITTEPAKPTNNSATTDTPATIFGNAGGFSFADLAKTTTTTAAAAADSESKPFNFPSSGDLSFGALAQGKSNTFLGAEQKKTPSASGFFGLSNRDTFSNLMGSTTNGTPKTGDGENENAVDDPNYDPHYEPIIELPDEIQVSTGEESEEKIFGERAKIYRYDATNKEVIYRYSDIFPLQFLSMNISFFDRPPPFPLRLSLSLCSSLYIAVERTRCWRIQNIASYHDECISFAATT